MKFEGAPRHRQHAINMIPLINIVFLLLIFFILTSTFRTVDPIDHQLPEAESSEPGVSVQAVLTVAADGELTIDGAPVARDGLAATFRAAVTAEKTTLLIKVAQLATVSMLQEVMDEAKAAGFEQVLLATRRAEPDTP